MILGVIKRLKKFINGEYPLDFVLYKLFIRQRLIGDSFPIKFYRMLEKKKNRIGNATELYLPTYDGLNQSTHPTICCYNGIFFLAATPFPYGNDLYENPCIYKSNDGKHFTPIEYAFPIVKPNKHSQLIYLSDPYLYVEDNKMSLVYRECVYNDIGTYVALLYKMEMDEEGMWSKPIKIFESNYGAMSPCILNEGGKKYIYYVSFAGNNTSLMKKSFCCDYEEVIFVDRIPENMMLWHIDIIRMDDNTTIGLFTMSEDHYGSKAKLYVAKRCDGKWRIGKEIILDNKLVTKMYKASIIKTIEGSYRLYVSLRRRDRKWKIYYIDNFRYQDYI